MKKFYFWCLVWLIVISCALVAGAQSVKIDKNGNYITVPREADVPTGKLFIDAKGKKFQIYETPKSKLYYWKISNKGNRYKVYIQNKFDFPYSVIIIDDNKVKLGCKGDTITLHLENSGIFKDEQVVFIEKN